MGLVSTVSVIHGLLQPYTQYTREWDKVHMVHPLYVVYRIHYYLQVQLFVVACGTDPLRI